MAQEIFQSLSGSEIHAVFGNIKFADIQMIKYADELKSITSKEFCEETKFPIGYGSEFSKMRNITERLKAAGLDVSKL